MSANYYKAHPADQGERMEDLAKTDETVEPRAPRPFLSRRLVLAGVGAAGVTVFAAGCSTYGDSGTSDAAPATPTQGADSSAAPSAAATTGGTTSDANAIAQISEIPVGGGKIFASEGVAITQPTTGTIKAFSLVCPHAGCKCDKITETINCPCHGSKFSIKDGSRTAGPAPRGLTEKQVTVSGTSITLA
jgi:nitrite reductase/ring-hydroxylating ferredoxin subunit